MRAWSLVGCLDRLEVLSRRFHFLSVSIQCWVIQRVPLSAGVRSQRFRPNHKSSVWVYGGFHKSGAPVHTA